MFQGPKGHIAQICIVHLQYETVQQNGRFTLFQVNSNLCMIYSLCNYYYQKTAKSYNSNFHIIYQAKWLHLLI